MATKDRNNGSALTLRGSFHPNPRVAPLFNGRLIPQGLDIEWTTDNPGASFMRVLTKNDFDVFEFLGFFAASSTYRSRPRRLQNSFHQAVPCAALHTLTTPLAGSGATRLANKLTGNFGHNQSIHNFIDTNKLRIYGCYGH